jgi:hypothetical protein
MPYPLVRLRVARLPSRRSGLTALRMGGSPSHPSSSHPPTSLRGIEFQGQRAAFGSPGQWSPNTVFNSRWKLTPPFQVSPTSIVVSFSAHPLSVVLQYKFIMLLHSPTFFIRSIHVIHSHCHHALAW